MRFNYTYTIWTVTFVTCFLLYFGCRSEVGAGPIAPDFTLSDLSGEMTTLSKHRGSVVLLDFWATWCPPCRMSIPELVKLKKKYEGKGVVILGISLDDPHQFSNEHLRAFKKKFRINYTILRYSKKVVRSYFPMKAYSIPTMFIIDKEGKIRDKLVGFKPGELEKSLKSVLE